jgi:hypothetical protein
VGIGLSRVTGELLDGSDFVDVPATLGVPLEVTVGLGNGRGWEGGLVLQANVNRQSSLLSLLADFGFAF